MSIKSDILNEIATLEEAIAVKKQHLAQIEQSIGSMIDKEENELKEMFAHITSHFSW